MMRLNKGIVDLRVYKKCFQKFKVRKKVSSFFFLSLVGVLFFFFDHIYFLDALTAAAQSSTDRERLQLLHASHNSEER